ncbi:hypothetical protein [Burkholderia thailandensis]|uniref:hypothetical protein n=2 Tax=Burkholderia TaxID=32008 RepID=UPI0018C7F8B4|nr:hypothetical protein [Burkholderia thailandensis]
MPLHEVRHPTSCRRWREAAIGQERSVDGGPKIVNNASAEDVEIGDMNKTREYLLPFGIDLRVEDGIASIESDLPEARPGFRDPVENGRIVGVVECIERILLTIFGGLRRREVQPGIAWAQQMTLKPT